MTEFDDYPDLPKWPALVVVGKSVTIEQAAEICIRTNGDYFCTNDRVWKDIVLHELGIPPELPYDAGNLDAIRARSREQRAAWEALSLIYGLEYLQNSRIVSSWIGGPHGWCDWNGEIGCRNYNIGKWPKVEEVHEQWKLIAEAFPFLDLTSQLFSGETSEEDSNPVVEFRVKEGLVTHSKPEHQLPYPSNTAVNDFFMSFGEVGSERGVTLEHLRRAVQWTREAMAAKAGVGTDVKLTEVLDEK